jgi:PPP family 3-phenylpropionic acid transporter
VLFGQAEGLIVFVLLSAFTNGAYIPLIPLADTLALARERSHGISYGSVRLWGSIAFILASVGCGELLSFGDEDVVLYSLVAIMSLTTVTAFALPDPPPRRDRPAPPPIGLLLRRPAFFVFVASAALAQASHAVYYAFGSIHWEAAGHSTAVVGMLWALGVIAEILLFLAGRRLTARFAPATLIGVGALTGLVRWGIIGSTTLLPALVFAQLLHATTFGAVHLGAMAFLAQRIPSGLSARAQTIYAAVVGGLAMGIAVPLSGPLYRELGGGAFHYAAIPSAGAVVLAVILRFTPDPGDGAPANPY